jgi:protocatechuate 3,4-dioxygenase beta subunit
MKSDASGTSPTGYRGVVWFDADASTASMRSAIAGTSIGESITGLVFNDKNGDGRRDRHDAGLLSRRVYIDVDNDKHFDAGEPSALTDAAGRYLFAGLAPGQYKVRTPFVSGWRQSNPAGGAGANVTVGERQTTANVDFGVTTNALVTGSVFYDSNGNHRRDAGEHGVAGVRVFVDLDNDGKFGRDGDISTLTDAAGNYTFVGLPAGAAGTTYHLRIVVPSGYRQTTHSAFDVRVASGQASPALVFGVKKTAAR